MLRQTYMDALVDGNATLDDLSRYRNEWSLYLNDSLDLSCAEYLGLTEYEYWLTHGGSDRAIMAMLVAVRKGYVLDY